MSVRSYYRWALALPLLVPALASPLALLDARPDVIDAMLFLLYWSVLIGGVPYLLFAGGFLLWMRRVPEHRVRVGVWLSPLVYTLVLLVCFTLFLLVDANLATGGDSLGIISVLAIPFGYAYVLVAEAGRLVIRPGKARGTPVPAL